MFGVGHAFLDGEAHKLEASGGVGYRDLEDDLGVETQEANQ